MKRIAGCIAAVLLLMLSVAAVAAAADHPDVNGEWQGVVESNTMGPSSVTLSITSRGEAPRER